MKGKIFMGALASLSLFLIASACDIGLGGAVDTEIPTGTISSPGVNAVIRDAFAIKGTWKDDGSVGQVTVALSNTNTKTTRTYNAKVAADGTWICAVDPADSAQPLVDGTYLATVTLYDNGGHTNTVTQSYIIDNTPPVVILSYLKSKDDSATEIKTYGKLFTLSGKAADDNNINRIDVKVYQDEACSTELRTITKLNVPAAIEQDVASFGTEEYSAIYGENSTNSQVRYCKVFAYDDAQCYPADGSAQTDSDKLGNCQTSYYFQTTIEKLGYDIYKTNDLYAMFNGTYSNGSQDSSRAVLTSDEISTVKKTLTETAVKVGTFALNPKNNPTFTVIGLNNYLPENQSMNNAQNKPDEKYYVTNGSGENGIPLTITLTPGRDNYAIDEATVKMYLQECDDKGIANGKKISLASNVTSFKTKTLSTFNYTALDTGSFYKVCVEGSDTKGNSLEADISGIYAFYFAPDTKTLELFVTGSPEYISSQTASKDLTLTLTYSYNGTASNPLHLFRKYQTDFTNEELKTLREQIKENPDNNGVIAARNTEIENLVNKYIVKNASGTPKELEIGTNKKFTDTFDAAATVDGTANKDKTYVSYFIMSDDKASYSNTKDYYIHVDDAKPALTVTAYPSPVQTSDNSFWFEGRSNDGDGSGVSKVLIKIKDESVSPAKETDWLEASGTSAWKFTIIKDSNFSNTDNPSYNGVFLKEGKKTVIVKAIDIVGLESEEVTKADWIYKPSKPKIGIYGYYLSEADVNDTTKRVEKRESDLISNSFDFAVGKKIILSGFATDTYGIDSITVTENDKKTCTVILNKDVTGSYMGTWQTELFPISELPAAGSTATYTYKFTIKDLAGIETPSKELKITVDLTPPVVDITSLGTGKFGESSISGSDVIFRGTASDPTPGTGLDVIKYAITSIDETNPSVWNTTNPDGNDWSITKVLKENQGTDSETDLYEGKKRLHVKAIDKAGNETKPHTIRDFCVDQKAPDVEVKVYRGSVSTPETAQQDGTYKITQEVSNFHITVTAKDANFIKKITVNDGSTITNEILAGNDLTYTWSSSDYNIEKTYNFEITVEDGSGNDTIAGKKTTKNVTVLFDKTKPEIKVMNGENEADTVKTAKLYWFSGTGNAYITGTAKDDQSGIDKMEIQIDSEGWNIIPTTDKWTYQYLLNGITENTDDDDSYHTIKVRITDKAGNTNNDEGQIYYFRYDKGAPKLTMFTSADSVNNEGKVIFSGQVYDGDSLEANRPVNYLTLEGKKAGSPDKIIPVVPNQDYTYHGNYTVTVDGFYLDEGDWNFVLTAEDYAGNEVTKEAVISVDKTPPTVKKVEADVVILPSSDNSVTDSLNKWYNKQTLSVIVSAEDNTAGSGIDKVEWRTAAIDSTATDETADWQPLTKKTEAGVITYNGSVVFDDAAAKEGSRLYIRAIDKAGNSTKFNTKVSSTDPNSAIDYIVFNIDTEKPTLTSKFYQVEGGSRKTSGGTIYLAENKRITVYGAFSDEQSGVQKLSYSLGGRDITSSVTTTYYSSDETLSEDKISTIFVDANKTTDKKSIKYWKAEFTPVLADNTNVDLVITGKDFADNESKIAPVFSMLKDTEEPVIDRKNVTFTITGNDEPVYMKGNKGETGEKYYVNNITQTFTLHGIATDNVGLDSVELKAKDKDGKDITITSTKSGSASNWTFSDIDLSSLSEKATLCVEVTDLAGNKNIALNQKITVVFDTEAPRGKHLADGKGKDIYFRIGNSNNDDILETDSLWDAALDVNAGSKYSAETYGNTKNIEIRGLFDDGDVLGTADVSGLKTIYYKVYKKSEYKAEFDKVTDKTYKELVEDNKTLASDIKSSYTGKITPESSTTEKRVFYTDTSKTSAGPTLDGKLTSEGYITDKDGNPKHWAKIKSNFDQTITGFDEEKNYLVLVAEDNVGNIAVDLVLLNEDATTHKGDSYNNFSLNVDTNPPVSGDFVISATYTNATTGTQATKLRNGDIVITGTVKDVLPNTNVPADSVSELKSLIVKVGNTDNKIEFKIKEEKENSTVVKNYYVNDVKQADVPAADVDFDSDTYKDKPNIFTTNKNSSDNLAVRKWKATIPGSYFAGLSGNVVIYAIAKDNAGNEKSVTAANVIVDSVKPAVTLNLTENTTVNGKQTLKGTISDSYLTEDPAGASEPGTLELFYTTKAGTTAAPDSIDSTAAATANAGTAWRKYGTIKHGPSFEFKDIDTAKLILSGGTDSTTYIPDQTKVYFTVKATDKAGNIGFSTPKSFIVDQDTDRPEITFKDIVLSAKDSNGNTVPMTMANKQWVKIESINGSATDDDGINQIWMMQKATVKDSSGTETIENPDWDDAGWINTDYDGSWQFNPTDGEGVIFIKVEDKAGGHFISKAGLSALDVSTPKVLDKSTPPNHYGYRTGNGVTATNNSFDSALYVKVDTQPPVIQTNIYCTTDASAIEGLTETTSSSLFNSLIDGSASESVKNKWTLISNFSDYIGGNTNKLYVLYASSDANGIESAPVEKIEKDNVFVNATPKIPANFKKTTDGTPCVRLLEFDVSTLSSGANTLSLQVRDQAGSPSQQKDYTVNIDNTAPIISDMNHSDGAEVYGGLSFTHSGQASDSHIKQLTKFFYAVTLEETDTPSYEEITEYVPVASGKWSITFDGNEVLNGSASTTYHAPLFNTFLDKLNGYTDPSAANYANRPSTKDDTQEMWLWLYAVDELGNSGINSPTKTKFTVFPLADKPTITIEGPDNNKTIGGKIQLYGSTSIEADAVKSVWIQIDPDFNGTFDDEIDKTIDATNTKPNWAIKLQALIDAKEINSEKVGYSITSNTGITGLTTAIKVAEAEEGKKIQSWSIELNKLNEFTQIPDGTDENGKQKYKNRVIAIKAYAVSDKNSIVSDYKQISLTIDPNRPQFSSEFTLTNSSDSSKSIKYVSGDWISGEWKLKGSVSHSSGIYSLVLNQTVYEGSATTGTASTTTLVDSYASKNPAGITLTPHAIIGKTGSDWDFEIPVGLAATNAIKAGKISITITATTEDNKSNDQDFELKFDNEAPLAASFTAKTDSLSEISSTDTSLNIFKQSSGKFKLSGKLNDNETGSGIARVAFYFTRTITEDGVTTTYLLDPMTGKVKTGETSAPKKYRNNYIDVSGLTGGNGFDDLYWRSNTVSSISGTQVTLSSDLAADVRKGSICKVNGIIYTIKDLDRTNKTVTLDASPTYKANLPIYFALAQVIDNTSEETGDTNLYSDTDSMSNKDGDCMQEYLNKSGVKSEWEASIKSTNIYDGPVQIHFVYYDKAGNTGSKTFEGQFCNNKPRISRVIVASDIDNNGYDESEKSYWYYRGDYVTVNEKRYASAAGEDEIFVSSDNTANGDAFKKVKGKTKIQAEIIGGNGKLWYSYNIGTSRGAASNVIKSEAKKGVNVSLGEGNQDNDDYFTGTNDQKHIEVDDSHIKAIEISVDDFSNYLNLGTGTGDSNTHYIANNTTQKPVTWFQYTIWDETDGLTKFDNSQKVIMNVALDVQVHDSTNPNVVIDKFYWNSSSDNSIYGNEPKNGHIELEKDLENSTTFNGSSGEYDKDPKVSGKITIRGAAWDDILLKELWIKIDGFTITGALTGTAPTDLTGYSKVAAYESSWTTPADTFATNGWSFAIDTTRQGSYIGEDGHKVYWILNLNTEKLTNVCQNDVKVQLAAVDYRSSRHSATSASGSLNANGTYEDKSYNKPSYQIDVVPYITDVETSISSFLSKDYTRSAVGDYPIKVAGSTGEVIKVKGFNLAPTNKVVDVDNTKSDVRLSNNKLALSGTNKTGTGLKVEEGEGDDAGKWLVTMSAAGNGYLVFFTNGIASLNNVDSEAEYNKETSLIHASLNNDRKFSLWDFTALRTNTSAPKANGATYPSMAMNGDTPQFAYVNNTEGYGLAEFWNGSTETKIYENWDLFTYTSLALNSEGKRAALYDINVVQGGTGYASDSGGIMTNFFNDPADSTWNGTCYYFRNNNVWMDGLYKAGKTAVLGRYQYPTIKMVGNNNISHVFYSVYDSMDDRVVFRYFTVGTSNTLVKNATAITSENSKVYINKNQLNQVSVGGTWPDYTRTSGWYSENNLRFSNEGSYSGTTTDPQAFATGATVGLYTATAGVPTTKDAAGNVTAARGILVYYAGTNMYYTYATNDANTSWSTPVILDSNCEASYISMVVDSGNHVHIAYQNNIAGDVKYIYIPTYSEPATRKTVTVDSYLTVGDKLTLDVVDSTPYIGYKGLGNTVKLAWYKANNGVPAVNTLKDGIDSNEKFTGDWNVEIIPNRVVDSDTNRLNVGVGRSNKRPVIGYSNNQSGSKGIEYLTRTADMAN